MSLKYYFFFLILLLFSCKSEPFQVKGKYYKEVEKLKSLEDKRTYLDEIYDHYIILRTKETEYWNQFGRRSNEYKNKVESNHKKDVVELQRVIAFLETYGHPNVMKVGRKASHIPCIQLTHSQNEVLLRRNFKYIYDGYKFNDISEEYFLNYLLKLSYASGNEFKNDSKITPRQNIEYLIAKLELN